MSQQPNVTRVNRTRVLLIAAALVIIVIAAFVVTQIIIPGSTPAISTGQPKAPTLNLGGPAKPASFQPAAQAVMDVRPIEQQAASTGTPQPFYTSCTVARGSTPTPTGAAPAAAATAVATAAATMSATQVVAAGPTVAPSYTVYEIAGSESQACYQVGEILFNENNRFNLAIGVTTAIDGQIAIDPTNLGATVVGQVVADVSQFTSDSSMRDGQIRRNWLQSNTYPKATFTPKQILGLPTGAYQAGQIINFKMVGTLNVHNTDFNTTFDVTAQLMDTNDLVVSASTDLKMSDFGIQVPQMAMLKANDDVHVILNLVAHPVKQ